MIPLATLWGMPDSLVTAIAVAAAGALGWLVKHITTRSGERALLLRTSADKREGENAAVVSRAIQGFETQVASYQRDLADARADVVKLRTEQCDAEKRHDIRISRMESKMGRMHSFILEIYTAYVDVRSYAGVLDVKLSFHLADWKGREFKEIKLPNFEEEQPIAPRS